MMRPQPNTDIAFFTAQLSTGGIGRMRINLANELFKRGYQVNLILGDANSPYLEMLNENIRVFALGTTHAISCLPRLAVYLRKTKPRALIADRIRLNIAAFRARAFARTDTRLLTSVHLPISVMLDLKKPSKRKAERAKIARYFPLNDGIIAISKGVAADITETFNLPENLLHVVYNPVVTDDMDTKAQEPADHPWVLDRQIPVILAAGRFRTQKDFPTLIRAFAKMREKRACRLMILGQGKGMEAIAELAAQLNIAEDLALPGFVSNPYKYMAKASLFVQSSAWEGFGNVLVEAMAVGVPVVSTDCRYGPREILQDGSLGPLVPVGDAQGLAAAMLKVLENPLPSETLIKGAARFTVSQCAEGYIDAAGLKHHTVGDP